MMTVPALANPKYESFAQALATGMSASDAYVSAGYKANRGNATRLNANESIAGRVAEIVAAGAQRAEASVGRVLRELTRVGFSDLRKAFDEDGNLRPPSQWDDDFAASVASIEVVTRALPGEADPELDGQPHGGALKRKRNPKVEYVSKIKFWDKNSAIEKLAKHLGMFVDRHEFSGVGGDAIKSEVTHKLDPASVKLIADLVK